MTILTKEQLAAHTGFTRSRFELHRSRTDWSIRAEYPCINGLSALFTLARVGKPDEAECGYTDDAFNPDVAEANAKLIAAAPDLLATALHLYAEVERLTAVYWALRSYAVHDNDCKVNKPPRFAGPCSCGLAAALIDWEARTEASHE